MAEDIRLRYQRLRWLVVKLETNHPQIDEMMLTQIDDGLGAMRYGQYGGSFPDPTARTVFDVSGDAREPVKWRDHRPEDDRRQYWDDLVLVEKALERMDAIRCRYMSANNDIKLRLDPTDWCRIHFHLQHFEGHRRYRGDLCSLCYRYKEANGHEPTPTEVDYHHTHGRWPHTLYDPKSRKVV